MANVARVGDPVFCPKDTHGVPPLIITLPVTGIFVSGSTNVLTNSLPTIREGDPGVHVACPGPNTFIAKKGASKTLVNSLPVMRDGDTTLHCGLSDGNVVKGMTSPNTFVE